MSKPLPNRYKKVADEYIGNPSAVLLLSAPLGSGKELIVRYVLDQLFETTSEVNKSSNVYSIGNQQSSISINDIRQIKSWLKLVPSSDADHRVVIIYRAELMTDEAQNAMLKMLEEVPQKTIFIMTCSNTSSLLETVTSRVRELRLPKPTLDETTIIFKDYDLQTIKRAYLMCDGRLRYINEVLEDPKAEYPQIIQNAKNLLAMTTYERLCSVDQIIRDFPTETYLLALKIIYKNILETTKSASQMRLRINILKSITTAETLLHRTNPNRKLLLTYLLFQM